jgi:hypothetical protein
MIGNPAASLTENIVPVKASVTLNSLPVDPSTVNLSSELVAVV